MLTFCQFSEAVKLPLYHGTADVHVASIKQHGLLAKPSVYLTTDLLVALQEAVHAVHGDPYAETKASSRALPLDGAKPVILVIDRGRVKGLKHDPEYLEGSTVRAHAFMTQQNIEASAIQRIVKGKASLKRLLDEFLRAGGEKEDSYRWYSVKRLLNEV